MGQYLSVNYKAEKVSESLLVKFTGLDLKIFFNCAEVRMIFF